MEDIRREGKVKRSERKKKEETGFEVMEIKFMEK